jgi:hypothetical protein
MEFQIECPKNGQSLQWAWASRSIGTAVVQFQEKVYASAVIQTRNLTGRTSQCTVVRSLSSCRPMATDWSSVTLREVLFSFGMLPLGRLYSLVKAVPGKGNRL